MADDSDQDDIYEVSKIVSCRTAPDGTLQYLVHWKGCDIDEDTWEPEDNLLNCRKAIVEFFERKRHASATPRKQKASKVFAAELARQEDNGLFMMKNIEERPAKHEDSSFYTTSTTHRTSRWRAGTTDEKSNHTSTIYTTPKIDVNVSDTKTNGVSRNMWNLLGSVLLVMVFMIGILGILLALILYEYQ